MFVLFNGIVRPYSAMNVFWKYWMYYANPSTWWLRGVYSSVLPSVEVSCLPSEMTQFNPPPGRTCGEYAGTYVSQLAQSGYLVDANATTDCQYCPYANGREYMHSLNVHDGDKWRCFGIFLAYVIINWGLLYFFVYTIRVRGWKFGMGLLFGALGSVIDKVKSSISLTSKKDNE